MNVHQLLSGAGPFDAVTREAIAIRGLLTDWGVGGGDFAVNIDPRVGRAVRPFERFAPAAVDASAIFPDAVMTAFR